MKILDILIAIFVAFAWGSNYVLVKLGLQEMPSIITIAIRFLLTTLLLFPFIKKPNIPFKELFLTSLIFAAYVSMVYWSIDLGASANLAVIIMQLNAPFTVFLAKFFLDEKYTINTVIGMILSLLGVMVIVYNPNIKGSLISIIVLLVAAFFNALFNIKSRKYNKVPPLDLLCYLSLLSTPYLFIISYFLEGSFINLMPGLTTMFFSTLFYSVTVAGIIGLTAWIYLLQKYQVYKVMPFGLLVPLFGIICSVLVLKEEISLHLIFGGALVIVGVVFSQKKNLS